MYYNLISSMKRRLILELQESFSRHPIYDKAVPFIQNKYAFDERPQFGLVVKGSNANKVQLSADNFLGVVQSHVMLSYLEKPCFLLEWVREDIARVRNNNDVMPAPPGVYYLECLEEPTSGGAPGKFVIDPLLTITDEPLLLVQSGVESEAQLQNLPVQNTLRIWEGRNHLLEEGRDFRVDYETGALAFLTPLTPGATITAEYRYAAPSIGPLEWQWNTSDWNTIPGCCLAFGRRGRVGDKLAVVVYADRVDTANAYGGRFDLTFDVDVIAQDPIQMEEMADYTFMSLWSEKRSWLSSEGIEIIEVGMGGEAEESYDETADLFTFTAAMNIQIQSDWEIHIPLPFTISRATANNHQISGSQLFFATSPIIVNRNLSYEKIT